MACGVYKSSLKGGNEQGTIIRGFRTIAKEVSKFGIDQLRTASGRTNSG